MYHPIIVLVIFTLFQVISAASPQTVSQDEERMDRIRRIVYSAVSNLTLQLMSMENELTGRADLVPQESHTMSAHLLENWMKVIKGDEVEQISEMDRAFAHTMESLNETLPLVIKELYIATGTLSRQDQMPEFYQGPFSFISAAVFGVVFYEFVKNLPSMIHKTSNWIHDTQDELASAVDRLLHNHPQVLNGTNASEPLLYKNMAWNPTFFKNITVTPDYVKNLFKI